MHFTYDAIGRRVRSDRGGAGPVDFLYDLGGNVVTWLGTNATYGRGELFLGNMHLGTYMGNFTYFVHTDLIGSERVRTDQNGNVAQTCTFWPFGDWQSCTGITFSSNYMYAGYERDPETGLDHMWFRYYNSRLGRFMSADPLGGSIFDPQSLNRFAYVLNNPTNLIDPLGLKPPLGCGRSDACITSRGGYAYDAFNFSFVSNPSNLGLVGDWSYVSGYQGQENTFIGDNFETGTIYTGNAHWIFTPSGSSSMIFTNDPGGGGGASRGVDILGALGQLFRGRPPGQSFADCVKSNIKQLTLGTVDADKIGDQTILAIIEAGTVASALAGTAARDPVTGVKASVGTIALMTVTRAAGLTGAVRAGTVRGGVYLLRGAAIAAAATVGAVIGSSANCAAEGID